MTSTGNVDDETESNRIIPSTGQSGGRSPKEGRRRWCTPPAPSRPRRRRGVTTGKQPPYLSAMANKRKEHFSWPIIEQTNTRRITTRRKSDGKILQRPTQTQTKLFKTQKERKKERKKDKAIFICFYATIPATRTLPATFQNEKSK